LYRKFDLTDIVLVPAVLSDIKSRSEVNPYYKKLPLIAAPMDTVISIDTNLSNGTRPKFSSKIDVCLPRTAKNLFKLWFYNNDFVSISLTEFEALILYYETYRIIPSMKILVDVANGHMRKLFDLTQKFLEIRNPNHELMVGNIANPETYREYAKLGVDYIRVSIGSGNACLTSANIGVHYPMGSLIAECHTIKRDNNYKTNIVADGGFRNYDEIIKALAVGADYVMIGSILNKTLESCSQTKLFKTIPLSPKMSQLVWKKVPFLRKHFYKLYRGMSTKQVQESWGKKNLTTAEGISFYNKVEYTFDSWVENFTAYLTSSMSYCGAKTLDEFKNTEYVFITQNALARYKK